MHVKQAIIIRKDLKMSPGKIAAQSSHASMKAVLDRCNILENRTLFMSNMPEPMYFWLTGIFTKIALGVGSEEEMLDLYEQAVSLDIPCSLITDSGLTVFKGVPTNTCIAIGPDDSDKIDKITSHLKLF